MKHFRQGHNECFPTAIACYLERDPQEIINAMLGPQLKPYGWQLATWNMNSDIFSIVESRVTGFLRDHIPWLPFDAFIKSESYFPSLRLFPSRLEGKGFLTTLGYDGIRLYNRHIIAFEDEMIYDTNLDLPMFYYPYRSIKTRANRFVDGIYYEPKKEGLNESV